MKVRAILEFDLEDQDGDPVRDRREYVWAAEATDDAIRARLMGHGFLADDTLIGTYAVNVSIVDDATDNRDPDDLMTNHGGVWGEHPDQPVASWMYEVANGETRSGYWHWVESSIEVSEPADHDPPDRP